MSDTGSNTGIGTVSALTLIFVVNKLTHAGDIAGWSWWWVLSPIWISLAFALGVAIVAGIVKAVTS
jgi:hypothetical protein